MPMAIWPTTWRRCSVTTARPLTPAILGQVRATLEGTTGKHVILEQRVDPDIMGGMVVRLGDTVFDASVRARLSSMRDAMLRPVAQA
ncbi:MAG: F0F1 ATP synthase subunit delta [Oligoflexia bacterium]|nr:F0F1 ATP synthase subunit delta [Oligoflexia bacterium]